MPTKDSAATNTNTTVAKLGRKKTKNNCLTWNSVRSNPEISPKKSGPQLHLRRLSYPSWRSCAVSNLQEIWFGDFLKNKNIYKNSLQNILRKNLRTKKHSLPIHILDLMFQAAKRAFFSILVPMYWSCWSTSICKSLESFSLIDPGWSISALNFGEGTCTESSIDIGIRKQRLISDVTKYFTWNWCSKKGLETCPLKQTLRYSFFYPKNSLKCGVCFFINTGFGNQCIDAWNLFVAPKARAAIGMPICSDKFPAPNVTCLVCLSMFGSFCAVALYWRAVSLPPFSLKGATFIDFLSKMQTQFASEFRMLRA